MIHCFCGNITRKDHAEPLLFPLLPPGHPCPFQILGLPFGTTSLCGGLA